MAPFADIDEIRTIEIVGKRTFGPMSICNCYFTARLTAARSLFRAATPSAFGMAGAYSCARMAMRLPEKVPTQTSSPTSSAMVALLQEGVAGPLLMTSVARVAGSMA